MSSFVRRLPAGTGRTFIGTEKGQASNKADQNQPVKEETRPCNRVRIIKYAVLAFFVF